MTAMFQCLEAVEQNNPKILAQIDTSVVSETFYIYIFKKIKKNQLTLHAITESCYILWARGFTGKF